MSDLSKFYSNDIAVPEISLANWIERDQNENLSALFSLKTGQISKVIEIAKLFYIFQITDKRSSGIHGFESVKNRVRRAYLEQQERVAFDKWLTTQLKESKVFIDYQAIKSLKVDIE